MVAFSMTWRKNISGRPEINFLLRQGKLNFRVYEARATFKCQVKRTLAEIDEARHKLKDHWLKNNVSQIHHLTIHSFQVSFAPRGISVWIARKCFWLVELWLKTYFQPSLVRFWRGHFCFLHGQLPIEHAKTGSFWWFEIRSLHLMTRPYIDGHTAVCIILLPCAKFSRTSFFVAEPHSTPFWLMPGTR
jgi:hypothetical protein